MKKTVFYFAAAVVLGIAFTLVPLITMAEIKPVDSYGMSLSTLNKSMQELERYTLLGKQENFFDEITVLAVSFVIACVGYIALRRKATRYEYRWVRCC